MTYPLHDRDVVVTARGRLCLHRKKINISTVLAGQRLGIKEVDAAFGSSASRTMASRLVRPGAKSPAAPRQPLRPKVVTHGLGTFCYLCLQAGHDFVGAARGIRTPGPIITNDVLYQLSYCGFREDSCWNLLVNAAPLSNAAARCAGPVRAFRP